jgi:hypothetical protein
LPDVIFEEDNSAWRDKVISSGSLTVEAGTVCTEDLDTRERLHAGAVQSRAKVPTEFSEIPRNAQIIDDSIPGGVLEIFM